MKGLKLLQRCDLAGTRFVVLTSVSAILVGLVTGCGTVTPEPRTYGNVVLLRQPAGELKGKKLSDVLVEAKATIARVPLHSQTVRDVAKNAKGTVVSIYTQTASPYRLRLLPIKIPGGGFRVTVRGRALGSGFFIHPSGYLLTNNHVIEGATKIWGVTADGKNCRLKVVARYPHGDMALLKATGSSVKFSVLPVGDSSAVAPGDFVVAMGNPLGFGHTVTTGIISQTSRDLSAVSGDEERDSDMRFLQTDAAINPGSSGGPLITITGAWVGINTSMMPDAQGIGFAVPSSEAKSFLKEVLAGHGKQEAGGE